MAATVVAPWPTSTAHGQERTFTIDAQFAFANGSRASRALTLLAPSTHRSADALMSMR